MLKKQLRTGAFLLMILVVFAGTAKAYDVAYKTIYVTDGKEQIRYRTSKDTVGEFLSNEDIILADMDKISVGLDSSLRDDMKITITRAFNVSLLIDDKERRIVKTNEETIGGLLTVLKKEDSKSEYSLAEDYSLSQKLSPDITIKLTTRREEIIVTTEAIPYETQVIDNADMLIGTEQIKAQGVEGTREITVKNIYVSGNPISTEEISDIVTKEPVAHIIERGTKQPFETVSTEVGTFKSQKKITMNATAYTAISACATKKPGDPGYGITATGIKATRGVVAVDPKFIPLGTKLYIEGYGYAVAADTGGAIKSNKIDLYYDTHNECIKFGRRNVTVHVLGERVS